MPLLSLLMAFIVPRVWWGYSGEDRDSPVFTASFPGCGLVFPLRGTGGRTVVAAGTGRGPNADAADLLWPIPKSFTSYPSHKVTFPQVAKSLTGRNW
ncbi:hypothetical protein CVA01_18000 [Corynebacterium variabile]|uniref:Uncharacterized protein n=1 Tax=Corynebacterium variabile TaxID=1727 RepID=A0A4Y4C2Y1_9CORY|nr:hypothetical protein CVA01_18000 [Corynebacterium variabile]